MAPSANAILGDRPLIPTSILFAAGTALGCWCASATAALVALAVCAATVVMAVAMPRRRLPLILAAIACAAFWRGASVSAPVKASERDFAMMSQEDQRVAVAGEVAAIYRSEKTDRGDWRHLFLLKNCSWRIRGPARKLVSPLLVEWYAKNQGDGSCAITRGDMIEATGMIHARSTSSADPESVRAVKLVSYASSTRLFPRPLDPTLLGRIRRSAASILSMGTGGFPEERDLVLAMVLGLRDGVSWETREKFRRAGTIHIFAISGLHVGAMALVIAAFLSFAGIPRTFVILPLAPLISAYVYMTGMQPSAIRAALMVCIYYFAIFAGRRPDTLCSIAMALVAILAADPLSVSDVGLLLSFAMVLGIILFTGPIANILAAVSGIASLEMERNIALASEACGDPFTLVYRWPKDFLVRAMGVALKTFSAALSAALVSFPLTAFFFGTYVPYSLLANTIVVPLAFPVMAISGIGLLLSAISPVFAVVAGGIAVRLAWVMRAISEAVAALPHSMIKGRFPLWALALWYAALFVLLKGIPGLCGPIIPVAAHDREPDFDD